MRFLLGRKRHGADNDVTSHSSLLGGSNASSQYEKYSFDNIQFSSSTELTPTKSKRGSSRRNSEKRIPPGINDKSHVLVRKEVNMSSRLFCLPTRRKVVLLPAPPKLEPVSPASTASTSNVSSTIKNHSDYNNNNNNNDNNIVDGKSLCASVSSQEIKRQLDDFFQLDLNLFCNNDNDGEDTAENRDPPSKTKINHHDTTTSCNNSHYIVTKEDTTDTNWMDMTGAAVVSTVQDTSENNHQDQINSSQITEPPNKSSSHRSIQSPLTSTNKQKTKQQQQQLQLQQIPPRPPHIDMKEGIHVDEDGATWLVFDNIPMEKQKDFNNSDDNIVDDDFFLSIMSSSLSQDQGDEIRYSQHPYPATNTAAYPIRKSISAITTASQETAKRRQRCQESSRYRAAQFPNNNNNNNNTQDNRNSPSFLNGMRTGQQFQHPTTTNHQHQHQHHIDHPFHFYNNSLPFFDNVMDTLCSFAPELSDNYIISTQQQRGRDSY